MAGQEARCSTTELPLSMCGCAQHRGPSTSTGSETAHPRRPYHGDRPPKEAILVSGTGTAHHYGCQHLPDYAYLIPPVYGWIIDAAAWQRIGTHQVPATAGN
jgi:hypothetical protein